MADRICSVPGNYSGTRLPVLSEPVLPRRHGHLEPGAPARLSGLGNGNSRDGKDLPGEEEAKTGISAKSPLEQVLPLLRPYSDTVVFDNKYQILTG